MFLCGLCVLCGWMWTVAKNRRHDVVAVAEDVRDDLHTLAYGALDRKAATVDFWSDSLDDHSTDVESR